MTTAAFGFKNVSKKDGSTDDSWFNYICGHCNREVSGAVLCSTLRPPVVRWLQCPSCHEPSTLSSSGHVFPGVPFGPVIDGMPDVVAEAYEEARRCFSVNAFTAAEGLCRKILMHVAVDKGSAEGKTFASYIDHLESQGFVTPPMKPWVSLIKDHGNRAQHEIAPPDQSRAESTLQFTAQLLRSVYEMNELAGRYAPVEGDQ